MKLNRILAMILAAAMFMTSFAVMPVFAAEPCPVGSMEDLLAAIEAEEASIIITEDFDVTELAWFDYSVAIDGNGKTLSRGEDYLGVILLFTGETASVEDLTVDGKDIECFTGNHDTYNWVYDPESGEYIKDYSHGYYSDLDYYTVADDIHYYFSFAAITACHETTLTMKGCEIIDNGAVGVFSSHNLEISDCTLSGNANGGVYVWPDSEQEAGTQLTMTGCTLTQNGNDAVYYDCNDIERLPGIAVIKDCEMTDNDGAGLDLWYSQKIEVENCVITGNTYCGINAGGIAEFIVEDCTITDNTAEWCGGAGVYFCGGEMNITGNTVISGNKAADCGGGIYAEYGTFWVGDEKNVLSSDVIVGKNVVISGNYAEDCGGGIYVGEDASLNLEGTCEGNASENKGDDIYILGGTELLYKASFEDEDLKYSRVYISGAEAEISDGMLQKSGHVILSWNTEEDGSGTKYLPGDKITMDEDKVLYAIWEKGFTLEHLPGADGVTNLPGEALILAAENTYVVSDTVPERQGYKFISWQLDFAKYTQYSVRYLDVETNKAVAGGRTVGYKKVGSTVTEKAINIDEYNLIGEELQSKALEQNAEDNVITFYYEKRSVLSYEDLTPKSYTEDYFTDELYIVHHIDLVRYQEFFTESGTAMAGESITVYALRDFDYYYPLDPVEQTCDSVPCNHVLEHQDFEVIDEGWYRIITGSEFNWEVEGLQRNCVVAEKDDQYVIWTLDQLTEEEQLEVYESFKDNVYGMSDAEFGNCTFMYGNGSSYRGVTIDGDYISFDVKSGWSLAIGFYYPAYEKIYEKGDILEYTFYYMYQPAVR